MREDGNNLPPLHRPVHPFVFIFSLARSHQSCILLQSNTAAVEKILGSGEVCINYLWVAFSSRGDKQVKGHGSCKKSNARLLLLLFSHRGHDVGGPYIPEQLHARLVIEDLLHQGPQDLCNAVSHHIELVVMLRHVIMRDNQKKNKHHRTMSK